MFRWGGGPDYGWEFFVLARHRCRIMVMEKAIRNVLVVGVEAGFHRRFEPLLKRRHFDVDRVAEAGCALALIQAVAIDVLVLRFPLGNPSTKDLLGAIRAEGSPCRRSAVLVLASPSDLEEAKRLVDHEGIRVLSIESDDRTLQDVISALLRMAPRLSVRITIRLEAMLENRSTMVLTQTENVSRGGMLVRVRKPPPVDARLRFELLLPEDSAPVRGAGEVVRHTRDWRGDVSGVGIKYLTFEDAGNERLKEFLARIGIDGGRGNEV